ncbi:probable glutamate receptor [Portunus trituberculatus]|uniref:probable glutamate receptor n=1 Tax=Portunus trituberculatus TaxID=210409 RepID=UPI001E1CF1BB|nr:probable glutamate receptor [Portunus trituberculatus]
MRVPQEGPRHNHYVIVLYMEKSLHELPDAYRQIFQAVSCLLLVEGAAYVPEVVVCSKPGPGYSTVPEIIPIPKCNHLKEFNDLRPVALTSAIMKCLEHIVKKLICISIATLRDNLQFAYCQGRSVQDANLTLLHRTCDHLENRNSQTRQEISTPYATHKFSCRLPVDRQWGSIDDGTWTGMVGEVYRGAAAIALAALDATPERRSAVDFLLPISDTDYLLTVRQPSNNDKTWSIYSEEFSSDVWIFLAGAMILLVIGLYISATNILDEEHLSASDSFFIVLGALCGQGCCWKPIRFPGRLMLLTIMGLHVILLAHYTSNLVSSLSVGPSLPSISSIEDVFQNPKFNLLVKKGTASVEYLKESLRSDHWKSLLSRGEEALVTTNEEGMSKVLKNNYAYLSPNSFLFNEYAQDCRIHIVPKPQFRKENSFAMRKGSPLIRILNAIIVKMKESGVMSQLERRWMKELSECHIETTIISITTVSSPLC